MRNPDAREGRKFSSRELSLPHAVQKRNWEKEKERSIHVINI